MRRSYARGESAVEEFAVAGLTVPVTLRRHPSARRMTLRISQTSRGVVLTMPPDCGLSEAGTFVSKHVDWVKKHLDKMAPAVAFRDGAVVPLRGDNYSISFKGASQRGRVVWVEPAQQDLFPLVDIVEEDASTQGRLCVSGMVEHAPRRLRDWLIAQARTDISERVAWHANNLCLTPKRITIRDQTTRWGSCSSSGALSFSWRLILAPPSVLEYVAAHEVAHLREMNHSSRFWNLVRRTMPGMDEPKRWLHNNGATLHSYGD